jgi:hypothetical protein
MAVRMIFLRPVPYDFKKVPEGSFRSSLRGSGYPLPNESASLPPITLTAQVAIQGCRFSSCARPCSFPQLCDAEENESLRFRVTRSFEQ